MADTVLSSADEGNADPYVSTHSQRRKLALLGALVAAGYLVATVIAGPSLAGRVVDSSIMAATAALSFVLATKASFRAHQAVRMLWMSFAVGVGFYAVVFGLQAARFGGCEWCTTAAAGIGVAAWMSLSLVLWGALRLAYREADCRLWTIEVLDAAVVFISAAALLGLLVEFGKVLVPRPVASVEFVEFVGILLLIVGAMFNLRSVSVDLKSYKTLQGLFLLGVACWVLARSWNALAAEGIRWLVFAASRATVVFCAILIPSYAVAPGAKLEILNVRRPEDRPITDVSLAVGSLALAAVVIHFSAGSESLLFNAFLPVLAFVSLLLVVRLALSSEHHRRLEDLIRESSTRFEELVEGAQQGILEVAADGTVGYCNEATARILGVSRSELMGRSLSGIVKVIDTYPRSEEDVLVSPLAKESKVALGSRLARGGRAVGQVMRSDGLRRYVELAPSSGMVWPLRVLLRDITFEVEQRLRVQRLIRDLRNKDMERSALMRDMLETAESERYLSGSQLHDGPVQHLTLLALKTDLLRKKAARGAYDEVVSEICRIGPEIKSQAKYLVDLSNALSPVVRPDVHLELALEGMMHSIFESPPGYEPTRWKLSTVEGVSSSLTPSVKIALYRCIQAIALDGRIAGARRAHFELGIEGGAVKAKVVTDAPLDSARPRGVARAKVWVSRMGGTFSEGRNGGLYEAEIRIPSTKE